MPNIGNHVDAIFLPESVNTSTTLKINGGDLNVNNGQFFVDQSTTNVGIGTTQPQHLLDIWGDGPDTAQLTLRQWNNNPSNVQDGPDMRFIASGGTIASPAEMDDNDVIGKVNAFAYDGTSSVQYGGFGWRYRDHLGGRGSSFSIETKSVYETSNSAKIYISEEGVVGIGTTSPISVNLQINGFYNSGTSEYEAPTQYFYTNLSSVSSGTNIGRIIFARSGASAVIAAKSTGTANETDLYFYNRTSGGGDNVSNILNTTPTLKLYHDKTAEFASDLTIGGNLTVNGTTTTINSTTLTVDDKNIVLASGAADSAAADGAGITIDGANETFTYEDTNKSFKLSQRLGIKAEANITSNLRVGGNAGGEGNGTVYYNILNNSVVQPDITGSFYYNFAQIKTGSNSGTAYTIDHVQGYTATVGSINTDTTITNLTGFNVKNSWTGGTNNYGFRGQISTDTNRWNVYMDGTAPNYFAGNVGVGETNPTKLLDVNGDALINDLTVGRGAGNVSSNTVVGNSALNANTTGSQNTAVGERALQNNTTGRYSTALGLYALRSQTEARYSTGIGAKALYNNTTGNFNTAIGQEAGYYIEGAHNTILGAYKGTAADATLSNTVIISAGQTERLRIDSSGNVGIDTTDPQAKLDVRSTADTPSLTFNGSGQAIVGDSATQLAIGRYSSSPFSLYLQGRASNNVARNIALSPAGGNVGIGTDSPQRKLEIAGSGGANFVELRLNATDGGERQITFVGSGSNTHTIKSTGTSSNSLVFIQGPDTRMLIDSSGNVGIGTDDPDSKLEVRDGASTGIISRSTNTQATDTNKALKVRNNSDTNTFSVSYRGAGYFASNVGIGTDNPSAKLHVSGGDLYVNSLDGSEVDIKLGIHATHSNFGVIKNVRASDNQNYLSFNIHQVNTLYEALQIHYDEGLYVRGNQDYSTTPYTGTVTTINLGDQAGRFANIVAESESASSVLGALVFKTRGSSFPAFMPQERLRITSAGNVGIGTNAPTEALDVSGVAMASLLVDSVYASETWPAGRTTLAGHDFGTWTLTGGTLIDEPSSPTGDYHEVDTANLPQGLTAIVWNGNSSTSYLESPNINITNLRTNTGIFGGVSDFSAGTERTIADSRIYLTALLATQSMDTLGEYMEIELSDDGGTTWAPDIAFVSQDNDNDNDDITDTSWRKIVIDISEYSSSTFRIRFKGAGVGAGDGYGVSNIYIHEAPIPNRLQAKTLKLGAGKIANSTYEHSDALTLVANSITSKLIVLEAASDPRQNYIGINGSDNLEFAADEDDVGADSSMRFRIDGKERMKLYTSSNSGAAVAHLQLIGHTTPTDRSNWRITAQDDGTHGYFTISNFSGGVWNTNLTVHQSGNVGIGTTDPLGKLDIRLPDLDGEDPDAYFRIRSIPEGGGGATLEVNNAAGTALGHMDLRGSNFTFKTYDPLSNTTTTKMAINDSGNVVVNNRLYVGGTTNYFSSQPTGNYGSVQINGGGKGNWEGYSIDGRAVFMHDGSATMGLYDDVNNHWVLHHSMGDSSVTSLRSGNSVATLTCTSNNQVGIGTATAARGPLHIHQGTTGDTQIHLTNSETGAASTDGFTIFTGGGDGSHSGFVNREASARIRFLMHPSGGASVADQMVLLADGNLGLGISDPIDKLHVAGGDAYFDRRVGIGTTDHTSYALSIRNISSPTNTGGIFVDCNDWSTNTSEYGIHVDIDSSNRTNLTANRTSYGIRAIANIRAATNASDTNTTRQSIFGIYGSAQVDDTDANDGKIYQLYGGYFRARVDGVSVGNMRGAYILAQASDNATGTARTIDNLYGTYSYALNDGNQTTFTNAYGVYSHVGQDDTGGAMTNAYGVYSRMDRDGGTAGTGYAFRGNFEGTWTTKYGVYMNGETINYFSGSVGIGTNNPLSKLMIGQDGSGTANVNAQIIFGKRVTTTQTNLPRIGHCDILGTASNNDLGICTTSSGGAIGLFTGNGEAGYGDSTNDLRMIIESNGNVGIGTNNPGQKFEVYTGTYDKVSIGNIGGTSDGDRHRFGIYRQDTVGGVVDNDAPMFHVNHGGAVYAHSSIISGRTRTDANAPTNIYAHGAHALDVYSGRTDVATAYRTRFFIKAWDAGDTGDRRVAYFLDSASDTTTADYDQHQRFSLAANGLLNTRYHVWAGRVESDEGTPNSVYQTSETGFYAYVTDANHFSRLLARDGQDTADVIRVEVDDNIKFEVRANGQIRADNGSLHSPADYAEMFEWEDGNPNNEDRRGRSVVLVGEKMRLATSEDASSSILGIVSANPVIVGDAAPLTWKDQYLKDEFGDYVTEDVEYLVWVNEHHYDTTQPKQLINKVVDSDDEGNLVYEEVMHHPKVRAPQPDPANPKTWFKGDRCKLSEVANRDDIPQWAIDQNIVVTSQQQVTNPDYDPTRPYIPRTERQEWDAVGLVGKLVMRKGEPTGDRWIKLSDLSDTLERWLVR